MTARDEALLALVQEPEQRRVDLPSALRAAPADLAADIVRHGIAGIAYHHITATTDEFPELVAALRDARQRGWSEHLAALTNLGQVRATLNELGAPWAAVKGPVLSHLAYQRPDQRFYNDLDVLVEPAAFPDALRALERDGAQLLDRNWKLNLAARSGALTLQLNDRIIDLHSHLLNLRPFPRRSAWKMDALLARTVTRVIGTHEVPTLDPVDATMHIAVHATLSGGNRLIWLKDLERQLAFAGVDSDELEARARAAGLWTPTAFALVRTAAAFNLPPPRRPRWVALAAWGGADRFVNDGRTAHLTRTMSIAARETLRASASAAVAAKLRHRLLHPEILNLEAVRRPGGTAADRDAYMAMIRDR